MVSGATVTSGGYVKSLQAALDEAVSGQGAMGAGPSQDHGAGPQSHVAGPQHRHGERTTMTSGGYVQIAAARPRRGWHMSSTAVQGLRDGDNHRPVEHIMRMPISLALRARQPGWPGFARYRRLHGRPPSAGPTDLSLRRFLRR